MTPKTSKTPRGGRLRALARALVFTVAAVWLSGACALDLEGLGPNGSTDGGLVGLGSSMVVTTGGSANATSGAASSSAAASTNTTGTTGGNASSSTSRFSRRSSDRADAAPDGTVDVTEAAAPDGSGGDDNAMVVGDETDMDTGTPAPDDAQPDGGACATAGVDCVPVPDGWTIVAFAATALPAVCPVGFSSPPTAVDEGPNADNACSCGACTANDACGGPIAVSYDLRPATSPGPCATDAAPLANDSADGCNTDVTQIPNGGEIANIALTPSDPSSACEDPGVADPSAVTYASSDLLCAADGTAGSCIGGSCSALLVPPFMECIAAMGEQPCPAGPFTVPHVVGSVPAVTCSDCPCSVSGTCTGTVTLYASNMCSDHNHDSVTADGTCQSFPGFAMFGAYQFTPSEGGVTCTASGPSAGMATFQDAETVCCAN